MIEKQFLKQAFVNYYGGDDSNVKFYFAPGRVNLIGEHQDYNGGHVFPAALKLGIYGAIRLRSDKLVNLYSDNTKSEINYNLENPIIYDESNGWANYPLGIIKSFIEDEVDVPGMDIYYSADLPVGAGLSSSAAILVLTAYMLVDILKLNLDKIEIAKRAKNVEYNFVGVKVGIMDQFVIANGKKQCGVLLDCSNLTYEIVPINWDNYELMIINTNKQRDLVNSEFNDRIAECKQAESEIRKYRSLVGLSYADENDLKLLSSEKLKRRTKHAFSENRRVKVFRDALVKSDIKAIAKVIDESHKSLRNDFEVSCDELNTLVEIAKSQQGVLAARMIGAGFGGCIIALVEKEYAEESKIKIYDEYLEKVGYPPSIYMANIGNGVHKL